MVGGTGGVVVLIGLAACMACRVIPGSRTVVLYT